MLLGSFSTTVTVSWPSNTYSDLIVVFKLRYAARDVSTHVTGRYRVSWVGCFAALVRVCCFQFRSFEHPALAFTSQGSVILAVEFRL
jgi:hypothetical protein